MTDKVLTAVVILMTELVLTTPVPASQPTAVGTQAHAPPSVRIGQGSN